MDNPLVRILLGIVIIFGVVLFLYFRFVPRIVNNTVENNTQNAETATNDASRFDNTTVNSPSNTATNVVSNTTEEPSGSLADPIAEFKQRVTKKFFGTYVIPQKSPVQPERFTGYHNAVDVEYTDTATDVPVFAIANGKIVSAQTASGYGGVFVLQFTYQGQAYTAIYGHIRPSTLPNIGTVVTKGQNLALLGTGFTSETDNERRNLHFGIHIGTSVDIKGYLPSTTGIDAWVDPLSWY